MFDKVKHGSYLVVTRNDIVLINVRTVPVHRKHLANSNHCFPGLSDHYYQLKPNLLNT